MNTSVQHTIILLAILFATTTPADVLVVQGGDALSGKVARIVDGTLVFRTTLQGQMMVPVDTITSLSTRNSLMISMRNQQVHYGRLRAQDGINHIEPLDGSPPQKINLAEIAQALPIPHTPTTEDDPSTPDTWTTTLDTGAQHRTGNRDRTEAFSRLSVSRASPRSQLSAEIKIEHDYQDGPSLLNATIDLQRKGSAPIQPYAEIRTTRNTDAALDRRTNLTLGIEKNLLGKSSHQLQARLGLNLAFENWDQRNRHTNTSQDNEKFNRELNLQLGLRYSHDLFGKGTFDGRFLLYPSLTEFGSIRSRSESAVRFPVTDHLHLRFDFSVEYDSEPEFSDLDEWNTSLGASIQVEF